MNTTGDMDTTTGAHSPWPHDELEGDFTHAVCGAHGENPDTRLVGLGAPAMDPLRIDDIAETVRFHVRFNGSDWQPGDGAGTELELVAVLRLLDGRWASVEAWNDYTGWGCQDGSDVRIGDSEEQVIRHGLSAEGRRALGYEDTTTDGGGA